MGYMTWKFKMGEKEIGIQAQKERAENIARHLQKLFRLNQYCREINGTIGGEEHSCVLMTILGPSGSPIREEAEFKVSLAALVEKIPNFLTPVTAASYLKEVDEIFERHVPIKDERQTPEQIAERDRINEEATAKWKAKDDAWRAVWCGKDKVKIESGQMAVILAMTYDNSDIMTDYFDSHAKIGDDMLLAIVPKRAQTEKTARDILAKYPELAKFEWTWHTENYSMGHGNYLMSAPTGHMEPHGGYDGRKEVATGWEIQFYPYAKEFYTYKDYPGSGPHQEPVQTDPLMAAPVTATVSRNMEHDGIEVSFPVKPSDEMISSLKGMGYRWSFKSHVWYIKYSDVRLAVIKEFLNIS